VSRLPVPRPRKCKNCGKEDCGDLKCKRCGRVGHSKVGRPEPSSRGGPSRGRKYIPDEEDHFPYQ